MPSISEIIIYPIKSLKGLSVQSAELTNRGLKHDRRWMLIDSQNHFLTQRELPEMALIEVSILDDGLEVKSARIVDSLFIPCKKEGSLKVENSENSSTIETWVFEDRVKVELCNQNAHLWFSKVLGINCRLVYLPDYSRRELSSKYSSTGEINNLSDSMPILLTSNSSLALLNEWLESPIPMNRFRPNLIISGGSAFEEDDYKQVHIGELSFKVAKPCARCTITTIDQATGLSSKEPLKTLSKFRSFDHKVLFGIYLKVGSQGEIQVGNSLQIDRKSLSR